MMQSLRVTCSATSVGGVVLEELVYVVVVLTASESEPWLLSSLSDVWETKQEQDEEEEFESEGRRRQPPEQ